MTITESGTLHHTGFVVRDMEKTAAKLAESGIGPWGVWTIEPAATTVRGREVPFSVRIAFTQVGDSSYELLAPHEGESIYVEHLAANGEGFHHTCISVPKPRGNAGCQGRTGPPGADYGPERGHG